MDCMVMRYRGDCDYHYFPSTAAIIIIYDGTPPSSPAHQFLVDLYASRGYSSWIMSGRDGGIWDVPGEFKDSLLKEALDKLENLSDDDRVDMGLERGEICHYHKHISGKPSSDKGERK